MNNPKKDNIGSFTVTSNDTVNDTLNLSDSEIIALNKRNSNIYHGIKDHPGLRFPQLYEFLKITDPTITRVTFSRRVSYMSDLIEFRGSSDWRIFY